MADIIQTRRDTAANWTLANPILADGEKGWERDTGKEKIGDGVSLWSLLPYFGGGGGGGLAAVVDDLTPQLGGALDVNGQLISAVPGIGNDINLVTFADSPAGSTGGINIVVGDAQGNTNSLIAGQDETDYVFNFNDGSSYVVGDVITLTDGSTVTVDAVSGGSVTEFTVTTSGGTFVVTEPRTNLFQASTTGSGQFFALEPRPSNVNTTNWDGGSVAIKAGGASGQGDRGGISILAGDGGASGGEILIKSGDSDALGGGNGGYAGTLEIAVGTSFGASGQDMLIRGGNTDYQGGDAFGGQVIIRGGASYASTGNPANSYGGNVRLEAGPGQYAGYPAVEDGGDVRIYAGDGTQVGGDILLQVGDDTTNGSNPGTVELRGPNGMPTAPIFEFTEARANGSEKVGIRASAQMDGGESYILTLPPTNSTGVQVLTNDGTGILSWEDGGGGGGGISAVVEDLTPQLGGPLDVNGQQIISVPGAAINIISQTTNYYGGDINILSGPTSTYNPPQINIAAGDGAYYGGKVILTAGDSPSGYYGGDIELRPGTCNYGTRTGAVLIANNGATGNPVGGLTDKLYNIGGALYWNGTLIGPA